MELGFTSLIVDQEDHEYSPENSEDFNDTKTTSSSLQKRSRRNSIRKRVISVPVKEIEGSRLKSEVNAPPSDSWSWRKYGQKPIKGSPYPRAYYRCSSSKGCPARKQVERDRADPKMVIVSYSCNHNHPWPASRTNNQNRHKNSTASPPPSSTPTTTQEDISNIDDDEEYSRHLIKRSIPDPEFTNLELGPFVTTTDQFCWFSGLESLSSTMQESPLMAGDIVCDAEMAMVYSIREEDESLFADLGELPECATVFGRKEGGEPPAAVHFGPLVWDKRIR